MKTVKYKIPCKVKSRTYFAPWVGKYFGLATGLVGSMVISFEINGQPSYSKNETERRSVYEKQINN